MTSCYLTIDDSPSPHTDAMIDFLDERHIQSLLFVRGDMIETYGVDSLIRAVKHGHVIGNHAYTHTHFNKLTFDEAVEEIERTDALIDKIYDQADIKRPEKYFRYPHLDRGTGKQLIGFETVGPNYRDYVQSLFFDGVRGDPIEPTHQELKHKNKIQNYLKQKSFVVPFKNITYPWYVQSEIAKAVDCLITFSTSDWMLLNRHKGQWHYKTIEDLKQKIDVDPWLNRDDSHACILMHDKPEDEFPPIFKSLIDHMINKGYTFLPYKT